MIKFIRKIYSKYFKNKNAELQKIKKEISIMKEEMIKLKEDNLFFLEQIKSLINNKNNAINNPSYFYQDEPIYEEIKEKSIFEDVKDEVTLLSIVRSDALPQLPARNEINKSKIATAYQKTDEVKPINVDKNIEGEPIYDVPKSIGGESMYENINGESIYDEVKPIDNIKSSRCSIS